MSGLSKWFSVENQPALRPIGNCDVCGVPGVYDGTVELAKRGVRCYEHAPSDVRAQFPPAPIVGWPPPRFDAVDFGVLEIGDGGAH